MQIIAQFLASDVHLLYLCYRIFDGLNDKICINALKIVKCYLVV